MTVEIHVVLLDSDEKCSSSMLVKCNDGDIVQIDTGALINQNAIVINPDIATSPPPDAVQPLPTLTVDSPTIMNPVPDPVPSVIPPPVTPVTLQVVPPFDPNAIPTPSTAVPPTTGM